MREEIVYSIVKEENHEENAFISGPDYSIYPAVGGAEYGVESRDRFRRTISWRYHSFVLSSPDMHGN